MGRTYPIAKKRRLNATLNLRDRELSASPPGAVVNCCRRYFEGFLPTTLISPIKGFDHDVCRFLPSGEFLVCIGNVELVLYRYTGLEDCRPCDISAQNIAPDGAHFSRFFQLVYRVPLVQSTEVLCKDFCLVVHQEEFILLASSTPQHARTPIPGVPAIVSQTFHLVRVADGTVCDRYTIADDFVHLAHNSGAALYDDLLAILAIRGQALHMLQVLPTGRLVWVQRLGSHCWEDDDLVLASQQAAEERWHAEQACPGHAFEGKAGTYGRLASGHVTPPGAPGIDDVLRSGRLGPAAATNGALRPLAGTAPAPPAPEEAAAPLRAASGPLAPWLAAPPGAAGASLAMARQLSQQLGGAEDRLGGEAPPSAGAEEVAGPGPGLEGPGRRRAGGLIEGLTHRILAYLFRERAGASVDGEALRRFYYDFEEYAGMFMWKAQFLDRRRLLLSVGPADAMIMRNPESGQSFLVVYDWVAGRVCDVHDLRSGALLDAYLAHAPHFHAPAAQRAAERYVTPGGAGLASRPTLLRYLAHGASQAQVVRRVLAALPASSQVLSLSPYLDARLFSYDDKLTAAACRPRPWAELPLKFAARAFPDSSRFRLLPCLAEGAGAVGAAPPPGRPPKQVVAYHFHPTVPFVLCVLATGAAAPHVCAYLHL